MHNKTWARTLLGAVVMNGAHLEVDGFEATEGALDPAQAFVSGDGAFPGMEITGGQAGAHDIRGRRGRPRVRWRVRVAGVAEGVVGEVAGGSVWPSCTCPCPGLPEGRCARGR